MTERELEHRLRTWFQDGVGADQPSPTLAARVATIPELHAPSAPWFLGGQRRLVWLVVALLLVTALIGGALAVGGLVRLPWLVERVTPHPASFAVCDLIRDATGQPDASGIGQGYTFDGDAHGVLPTTDADACVYGWDSSYRHRISSSGPSRPPRTKPTSYFRLYSTTPTRTTGSSGSIRWWSGAPIRPGIWAGVGSQREGEVFALVAVSDDPYFFVFTAADERSARAGAERVLAELHARRIGE